MKNLIAIITIVIASVSQAVAFGPTMSTSTLTVVKNEKAVIINLSNNSEAKHFTVIDATGKIVFEEGLDKYSNQVTYSLEQFPQGKYTLKVIGTDYEEISETVITKESLALETKTSHFKPVMKNKDNKIILSAFFNTASKVQFKVFDMDGELIYTENEYSIGNYTKIFSLEKLKSGKYTAVFYTDRFSVSKEIKL